MIRKFIPLWISLMLCLSISESVYSQETSNLGHTAFSEMLKTENAVLLDVRTPKEFETGHIENAALLDFNDPGFERKILALDKEKTYLLYCAVGGRSSKALHLMKSNGFINVYHLEGGIEAWQRNKKPVVTLPLKH